MFTIEDIQKLKPCEEYTREKLENLWEGKESLALREILELTIPIDDKNWVMPRLISNSEIVIKWARLCAHEAKKHAASAADRADARSARYARYARYAAEYARSAANAAADAAAEYARSAARSAAYWTAYYAADEYARSAANAAADRADARDTELYRLLTILCDMAEE